jgi:hypothetical protein
MPLGVASLHASQLSISSPELRAAHMAAGIDPLSSPDALDLFLGGGGGAGLDLDLGFDFSLPGMSPLDGCGPSAAVRAPGAGSSPAMSTIPGAEAPVRRLRCLDASHAAECTRCTPPPPLEEAALYELVGDPGRRNGEKKLRSLLTRTDEWCSSESRGAAAAELQGRFPKLASSLLARSSGSLSKELMLALLAQWGYKSDLWARRGNRRRLVPPEPQPESTWASTHELLQPLNAASVNAITGHLARAEAERSAESAAAYVRELKPLCVIAEHIRQKWIPAASNMLAAALVLTDAAAMDRFGAALDHIVAAGIRTFSGLEQQSLARLADPACGPAHSLWLKEQLVGQQASKRMFEVLNEFLAQPVPAESRSARTVSVIQFMTVFITSLVGGFDTRIAWMTRLADQAAVAGSPGGPHAFMFDPALPLQCRPPDDIAAPITALQR